VTKVLRSVVTGVGGYLPDEIVTNDDLAKIVDTSDEWIIERTGIRKRHRAAEGQPVSDLAVEAARRALEAAGKTPQDIDLIIVATTTPDLTFPATATIVQRKLGCPVGIAFDVQAVCSGFVYALSTADGFVARGRSKCALVIGAETMTRLMDWTDRGTCVLFGDGAGAVVLEPMEADGATSDRGLLGFALRADGTKQDLLYVDGGVSTSGQIGHLRMQGNQVFRHAVVNISEAIFAAAARRRDRSRRCRLVHSAPGQSADPGGRRRRVGIEEGKVISTVAEHANTSAASIPLAWAAGVTDGRIKPGQLLLLEAMGGGLTWGACVVRL
jgi:3-oxoacyl-[acyl-carrier-protein] synthase-3